MRADASVRLAFYVCEACVLTLVCLAGLLLARSAARRSGRAFPAVTPRRIAGMGLLLLLLGAATGEFIGPQAIIQYYAAALALGAGAGLWILSFAFAHRSAATTRKTQKAG